MTLIIFPILSSQLRDVSCQKCSNPGFQATDFYKLAPNVCGFSVLNLLRVTLLAPTVLWCFLDFGKFVNSWFNTPRCSTLYPPYVFIYFGAIRCRWCLHISIGRLLLESVCSETSASRRGVGELQSVLSISGVRGGTFSWGTALQAGKSRVWFPIGWMEFFFDLILPPALWFWVRLSL